MAGTGPGLESGTILNEEQVGRPDPMSTDHAPLEGVDVPHPEAAAEKFVRLSPEMIRGNAL